MAKKQKNKNSEVVLKASDFILEDDVNFKAGDVNTTDKREENELDGEQAASLNEQMNEGKAGNSTEDPAASASKKTEKGAKPINGTPRFIKLNRK